MTPERWRQVQDLCHAALARPAEDRAAFLATACAGDDVLRREVESRGVGAAHDYCELLQGRVIEAVLREEGIEAALLADVTQLDAGDVVGNRTGFPGDAQHVTGRDIEELGLLVDEACDQPGAGDPVDPGLFTGDPLHDGIPFPARGSPRRRRLPARWPASPTASK